MNIRLRALWIVAVAGLVCSCAVTSVKKTWKAPDSQGPVGKIAVLTVDDRGMLRRGFENRLATQLIEKGNGAVVTYDMLSLSEIKADKKAAAEKFRASGAEVVLILRLMDAWSTDRQVQPGGERYVGFVSDVGMVGWYDYFTVGFMSMSPTYGYMKTKVYLETSLFDLKTEKRIWMGVTESTIKENMDRVAELDPIIATILASMKKDGMIH